MKQARHCEGVMGWCNGYFVAINRIVDDCKNVQEIKGGYVT
jgi:hypothetical protein